MQVKDLGDIYMKLPIKGRCSLIYTDDISLTLISDRKLPVKRTLLISLFFLLSLPSFGQKIHFTDSANKWNFFVIELAHGSGTESHDHEFLNSDTVINGKRCVLYYNFAYYEDTVADKVFFMTLPDTTDLFLLYDYNLTPGDTIVNQTNEFGPLETSYNEVISIDSTQINGLWYKIWQLGGYIPPDHATTIYSFTIIEGIGCVNGLHFPCNPLGRTGNPTSQLQCFENNGASYPLSNPVFVTGQVSAWNFYFDNAASCNLNLDATNLSKGMEKVKVVPDPIDASSRIALPYEIKSGSLVVLNNLGQTFINTTFQNKGEFLIGDKINIPGLYFYKVTDDQSSKVFSGKFIYR